MSKPKLNYWHETHDHMAGHEKYPSVTLLDKNMGYGLSCEIEPDGNIKLVTRGGGGHGEETYEDAGRCAEDWINLITEAERVRQFYW